MWDITVYSVIFEGSLFLISVALIVLSIKRYLEKKKSKLTYLLILIYTGISLGILSSIISKLSFLFVDQTAIHPIWAFIVYRFLSFRFSLVFCIWAAFNTYRFKVQIFDSEKSTVQYRINLFLAVSNAVVWFILHEPAGHPHHNLYDTLSFAFSSLYLMYIFIPFATKCFRVAKKIKGVESREYVRGFQSLGLMGAFFILVFVSIVANELYVPIAGKEYTFFYFLVWSFGILGIASSYVGYIKPKA